MNKRLAFTMIELIFVIVVIGILAAIAIPRMSSAIDDANVAKAKSDVAALRSAIINERQGRLLSGQTSYISHLDKNGTTALGSGSEIFDDNDTNTANGRLLTTPVITGTSEGKWAKLSTNTYRFYASGASTDFTYTPSTGIFTCTRGATASGQLCSRIID